MANLTATHADEECFVELSKTTQGVSAITTLVRLMGLALSSGSWKKVCFTPLSVMYPLHNVLRCSPGAHHAVLARLSELAQNLNRLLSNPIRGRDMRVGLEALEVGIKTSRLLLQHQARLNPNPLPELRVVFGAGMLGVCWHRIRLNPQP
jgi:hypothetical protein